MLIVIAIYLRISQPKIFLSNNAKSLSESENLEDPYFIDSSEWSAEFTLWLDAKRVWLRTFFTLWFLCYELKYLRFVLAVVIATNSVESGLHFP